MYMIPRLYSELSKASIIEDVAPFDPPYPVKLIKRACSRYFSHLKRAKKMQELLSPEQLEVKARQARVASRRSKLCKRRQKMGQGMDLNEEEKLLLSDLRAELMTDEESEVDEIGNKTLVRRRLTWRNEPLEELIVKLDASRSSARGVMSRNEGAPSTRQPSVSIPGMYLSNMNVAAE
ncbi:uncharacterized protein C14orf93 homolog [Clytia hemisphaerica]|uniref:uncharacterized protein C14orf93 homolog n=1 Tax=Clytia hemisphaerica TaxID=252671 RepID=UPI0034D4B3BE